MSEPSNYSFLDRAIHRLAFANPGVQATAADIESLLFGRRFRQVAVERPVFVTSLPRAGTTLLLEILSQVPGIATHSYRDMPFVLAPVLWDAMSKVFRKPPQLLERAHGDGMTVGYDSPEAFEEVLWRSFWPDKYHGACIAIWSDRDESSEFRDAFADHIRKIITLRAAGQSPHRYASKNNANIARIGLLKRLFGDCTVLVPFRDPIGQAVSMLRQHRRFRSVHERDGFARGYMNDIGHLEFGDLHRPIAFEGIDEVRRQYDPDTLDYWVGYWDCAFRHVLRHRDDVALVSYEALCASGSKVMSGIAEHLTIPVSQLNEAVGDRMRPPRELAQDVTMRDEALARRARATFQELVQLAGGCDDNPRS